MADVEQDRRLSCAKCASLLETCSLQSSNTTSSQYSTGDEKLKKPRELPQHLVDHFAHKGIVIHPDGLATWDPQSKLYPRNWSRSRKCYDTSIILVLMVLMTLVSNTGSATAEQTYTAFGVSKKTCLLHFTFSYLCGQACGGLLLPPISETYGAHMIYVTSAALFGIANLLIGAFPQPAIIVIARFTCGFFSAAPGTVAAGNLESMWDARARIWVIHLWVVTAVVGLASGPAVATSIILSPLGWRWVYMILGFVSIVAAVFCMLMRESRPSKILLRTIRSFESATQSYGLYTESSAAALSVRNFCHTTLFLPVKLFFTEPIVALTSTMAASVYALIYMFPEALPDVYSGFGFSTVQISLTNLALICGIPFTFLSRLLDLRLANRRRRRGTPDEPEDKITGFILASPCLAISFVVFAASVPPMQTHLSPWVSLACLAGIGFSAVEFDNVLSGYLTDSYSSWAASANAPMAFLRAMFSGTFPLFAGDLFTVLNANNASFILAGLAVLYCLAAIWFARYGKHHREKSKFATQIAKLPLPS